MTIELLEKRILDRVEDTALGVFIIDAFEQYNRSCETSMRLMGSTENRQAKDETVSISEQLKEIWK